MSDTLRRSFRENTWLVSKEEAADGNLLEAVRLKVLDLPLESLPHAASWKWRSDRMTCPLTSPSAVCRQL